MAGQRLPQAIKVLRGTLDARTANPNEPKADTDQLQFVPEMLTGKAREQWVIIRPLLVESGIANNLDKLALIQLCQLWGRYIEAQEMIDKTGLVIRGRQNEPVRTPYLAIVNQLGPQITKLLTQFGMTPSSRSTVQSTGRRPKKKAGMFDDL